ncbi:MAG: cupin domain-containing protein [Elusimicrobia bacterium]|nr:cupin domain-containing protein [Elusimicrobiota bacterium]
MGKYDPQATNPRAKADARPSCIANLSEIAAETYERERDGIAGKTWDLGEATGAKLLGIDVTEIGPGKKSSHLHAHSHKEEFFYVLEGRCRLRLGASEHELRPGDAIARPAGTGVPHQFFNPYDAPCRVMMLGVQGGRGVEDVVDWPELNRELVIDAEGGRKVVKKKS